MTLYSVGLCPNLGLKTYAYSGTDMDAHLLHPRAAVKLLHASREPEESSPAICFVPSLTPHPLLLKTHASLNRRRHHHTNFELQNVTIQVY
jgi:hypothetical protein